MRPIRQVIAENLRYKYLSIAEDENRAVVRILLPVPADTAHPDVDEREFFSTQSILYRYVTRDDTLFYVSAEGIFDKTSRLGRLWWKPGANIQFITNTTLANQGVISVVSKHDCVPDSGERSTEWLQRIACQGLFQLYCRSSSESIAEAAQSFASDKDGKVYTNIDTTRIRPMTAAALHADPDASRFLMTIPVLSLPARVAPFQEFEGLLTLYRGEDNRIAEECSGDWWLVDALSGYVSTRKVVVDKGIGRFRARALDLRPGEVMELRVLDQAGHVFSSASISVEGGE